MAIYRERPCPICNGRGYITISSENSIGCASCEECFSTGHVMIPITNNERINELITPEESLSSSRDSVQMLSIQVFLVDFFSLKNMMRI